MHSTYSKGKRIGTSRIQRVRRRNYYWFKNRACANCAYHTVCCFV